VLKDQKDDMVLELAVAGDCDYIVTHNIKHFVTVFLNTMYTPLNPLFLEGTSNLPSLVGQASPLVIIMSGSVSLCMRDTTL